MAYELLSLEDLIAAKKTQRDKDWPMIRRLVEAHYDQFQDSAINAFVKFWLRESRTPDMLATLIAEYPTCVHEVSPLRPTLRNMVASDLPGIAHLLSVEEAEERARDAEYWRPLKAELESLRLNRKRRSN